MVLLTLLLSLFIAAIGATGLVSPLKLFCIVRRFQSPAGLYAAAGSRVVFGVALFFSAHGSRAPEVIRVVGIRVSWPVNILVSSKLSEAENRSV